MIEELLKEFWFFIVFITVIFLYIFCSEIIRNKKKGKRKNENKSGR